MLLPFLAKFFHCWSASIIRARVTLCSVLMILRCFWRGILLILWCHCLESVAQQPDCNPEFGRDINLHDCESAGREYIRDMPGLRTQSEFTAQNYFCNPRCSCSGPILKHFPQRHAEFRSCLLIARMADKCLIAQTSWNSVIRAMGHLSKTCVGARGGIGGELRLGNFIFQVKHSSHKELATVDMPAPASGASRPAAGPPQSPPPSTAIHPAKPSAASMSPPLASTRLPGGSFPALHAAALHGYGFGGIPTTDDFPVRASHPHSGPSAPAAGSSAPQSPSHRAAGPPSIQSLAEKFLPDVPPVRSPPAAAPPAAAANSVQARLVLLSTTAGPPPLGPPAHPQRRPPPPTELTAPVALPQNPPAAAQQMADSESTVANILAGMHEVTDENPSPPPAKRLRPNGAGDQAKHPLSRRLPRSLSRDKRS
jgi:hypothetical protein